MPTVQWGLHGMLAPHLPSMKKIPVWGAWFVDMSVNKGALMDSVLEVGEAAGIRVSKRQRLARMFVKS